MSPHRRPPRPARRGFTLIVILSVLVLVTVMVLAFMLRAGIERTSASRYEATTSARLLGQTVVGLVQGQINQATGQDTATTWTTQPGLARTFDNGGNPQQAFKLYSGPDMILGTGGALSASALQTSLAADLPPTAWASGKAVWTDLNAPVESDNVKVFPILEKPATAPDGFTIGAAPGATGYQPVPLPVRWLYVLKDGTLVAPPTGSNGTTVQLAGATADNPVTGRVAFWTDDDTCRVNINTAAEGTYWDTPRGASTTEQGYALYQPAQKEYQRYPGHPAMASLSTVFPKPAGMSDSQWAEQLYQIVPRVKGGAGSSLEGTVIASAALAPDADRLYPSVDELAFSPARGTNGTLTRTQIEQAKFFLTAHSRAPEVNLFNLPRVACWPVYRLSGTSFNATRTTTFDQLIATGSTVNGQPYYFQREQAGSPTNDINIPRNQQLYAYLQALTSTSIPGFGGNFQTKYGDDRDQILTEIFDYVRSTNLYDGTLAAGNQFTAPILGNAGHGWVVPTHYQAGGQVTQGFGRSFTLSEFGIGFICNAVADDPATPTDESYGSNLPANNYVLNNTPLAAGEKYIQAIIVLELFSPMFGWTAITPDMQVAISGLDNLSVTDSAGNTQNLGLPAGGANATVFFNTNVDGMFGGRSWGGNPGWRYTLYHKGSPARGAIPGDTASSGRQNYPFIGIPIKIKAPAVGGTMTFNGSDKIVVQLYAGAAVAVSPSTLMQTIRINLPSGTFPVPNLVNQDLATAGLPTMPMTSWWSLPASTGSYHGGLGRLSQSGSTTTYDASTKKLTGSAIFYNSPPAATATGTTYNFDVVRTVLPAHGDYRLVAGMNNVPNTVFVKQRYYDVQTQMIASNLSGPGLAASSEPGNDVAGTYFSSMPWATAYDLPSNASGTNLPDSTGDFDSGLPNTMDGPYVNKPDEGSINGLSNATLPYFANYASVKDTTAPYFSPNRLMPSPGMFGSLPTGIFAGVPWRTLLFRPQPNHFGALTKPEDHLFLDLFWMPVVEPYAISDRFSTEGKINMNYQIVPFGVGANPYLVRSTALRALLKSEKVAAIPNGTGKTTGYGLFKAFSSAPIAAGAAQTEARFAIDADQTLSQFDSKFSGGDVFRSASEICDLHIVPTGTALSSMTNAGAAGFWAAHVGTGDNLRERIYTTLYPRLTTRSNTFTVYFRVQSLKKAVSGDPGTWDENRDVITGEYRGSTTLERFIDANNAAIPDYASSAGNLSALPTLQKFYKWRVLDNRQFSP